MKNKKTIRIGTRGSALALIQSEIVRKELLDRFPDLSVEIVPIDTSGDWKPSQGEVRLSESKGGKAQFAKEIEEAILSGHVDCGVHSMKDMASVLPEGLQISHVLPRGSAADVYVSVRYPSLADLPEGAVVGTSSLRRQAFMLALRPDLVVEPLRGNVHTRLGKLDAGQVDATLLARAGLDRLGMTEAPGHDLDFETMLPAGGQGAIGIETCADRTDLFPFFDPLHCRETGLCVFAERGALAALGGSCHTPVGAHAVFDASSGIVTLALKVADLDGTGVYQERDHMICPDRDAAHAFGEALGARLRARIPAEMLARLGM